mgnify:CR=1 FL=1
MSGIISVIIWIVIMAAVSGVLKGKVTVRGLRTGIPITRTALPYRRRIPGTTGMQCRRAARHSRIIPQVRFRKSTGTVQ